MREKFLSGSTAIAKKSLITAVVTAGALFLTMTIQLSAQDLTADSTQAVTLSSQNTTTVAENSAEAGDPQVTQPAQTSTDDSNEAAQQPTLKAGKQSIRGFPAISATENSKLTFGDRLKLYRRSIFTPEILVGPAFGAGLGQWRNDPPEWRQGAAGYGRRFGSGLARSVIARTIGSGVAAADGEDPRFIRSEESGFFARTRHAVVYTFITRNQNGTRMPAFSRFAGAYGAAFAANQWYPSAENNTNHALKMGSTSIASSVGFHVLAEFWPDIKRAIHIGPR